MSFYEKLQQAEIATTINGFVNSFKFGGIKTLIIVPLRWQISDYYYNIEESYGHQLIFDTTSNYIKVASSKGDFYKLSDNLNFVSNHDSCWRDGTNTFIKKCAEQINVDLKEKYGEDYDEKCNLVCFFSHGFGIELKPDKVLNKHPLNSKFFIIEDRK